MGLKPNSNRYQRPFLDFMDYPHFKAIKYKTFAIDFSFLCEQFLIDTSQEKNILVVTEKGIVKIDKI